MAQEYNEEKWARAAAAALDVIELAKTGVYELYTKGRRDVNPSEGYPLTINPPKHDIYSNEDYPKDGKI